MAGEFGFQAGVDGGESTVGRSVWDGDASGLPCSARSEQSQNLSQTLADVLDFGGGMRGEWDGGLALVGFGFRAEVLARALDGESLVVEQLLDAQHAFHVALAVHALVRAALYRLQLREFAFPEAQYVGGQAAQAGHFADAEVELVGNENVVGFAFGFGFILARAVRLCLFSGSHVENSGRSRVVRLL